MQSSKESSPCKATKSKSSKNTDKKKKLSRIYSILAFWHRPRQNPNRKINYSKNFHEIKKDWIDFADGLEVDDIEKLKETNNLNGNIFELKEDKTRTQVFLWQKDEQK